jgi:hypothetical protein
VGIVPDVTVRPTLQGVANGQDELIAAAMRFIVGSGAPKIIPLDN